MNSAVVFCLVIAASMQVVTGLGNNNVVGQGRVCLVFRPGTQAPQVSCTACTSNARLACASSLLDSLSLVRVCSSNTTNSTIPSNICVLCRSNVGQIATCTGLQTITSATILTDTQFRCLERMCAFVIDAFYQGEEPASKSKTINIPFLNDGGRKKRYTSKTGEIIPYREYFKIDELPMETFVFEIDE